jgi:hypothetical protein
VVDKQPVACGVDTTSTSVAIGTTYTLTFVVYNTAGLQASVQRVVSVISPCKTSEFFCNGTCSKVGPDVILNLFWYCSSHIFEQNDPSPPTQVDCSTLASAASLPGVGSSTPRIAPLIVLLPSAETSWLSGSVNVGVNQSLYLQYGKVALVSIAPCPSLASANKTLSPSCAAAAWDNADRDLSANITVADVSNNPDQAM